MRTLLLVLTLLTTLTTTNATTCPLLSYPPMVSFTSGFHDIRATNGDFDNDGVEGFAIDHMNGGALSIFEADPATGSYTRYGIYNPSPNPPPATFLTPQVGDYDGDGNLDAAVVNNNIDRLFIFHGDGTGAMTPHPTSFANIHWYSSDHAADLTGDGIDDYLGWAPPCNIVYMEGSSSRSYSIHTVFSHPSGACEFRAGDLNGDSHPDLLVAIPISPTDANVVEAWLGTGSADYVATATKIRLVTGETSSVHQVRVLDINHDGYDDAVVVRSGGTGEIFLGPDLTRVEDPNLSTGQGRVFLVDIDHDGWLDTFTETQQNPPSSFAVSLDPVRFGKQFAYSKSSLATYASRPVDFDADGYVDLFESFDTAAPLNLYWGKITPSGPFDQPSSEFLTTLPSWSTTADLDGDLAVDVLAIQPSGDATVFWGAGSAHSPPVTLHDAGTTGLVLSVGAVVDIDGDGKFDLLAAQAGGQALHWSRNLGARSMAPMASFLASAGLASSPVITSIVPVSLDGNTHVDLLAVSSDGIALGLNSGDSSAMAWSVVTDGAYGSIARPVAGYIDDDSIGDLLYIDATGGELIAHQSGSGPSTSLGTSSSLVGTTHLALASMDGDSFLDLLWAAPTLGGVAWCAHTGASTLAGAYTLGACNMIDAGFDVNVFDTIDHEGNGFSHVILASATTIKWMYPALGKGTRLGERLSKEKTGLSGIVSVHADDLNDSGYYGFVVASSAGLHFMPQKAQFGALQSAGVFLTFDHPECGGVASMACVRAALARMSPCIDRPARLTIPPQIRSIGRCPTTPLELPGSLEITASQSHPGAAFDCQGSGVLFSVPAGASLWLTNVDVVGTASVESALAYPAITVGDNGRLLLERMNMSSCHALAGLGGGQGGAINLGAGASLRARHVSFIDNQAIGSGGAIFATGIDAALDLTDVHFEANTALGSVGVQSSGGGGVAVAGAGVQLSFTRVSFDSNVAALGSGGAMDIRGVSNQVSLTDVTFESNSAGSAGGALHVEGIATPSVVWVGPSSWARNNAALWGGVFALAAQPGLPSSPITTQVAQSSSQPGPQLTLGTGVVIDSGSAQYGALGYVCDAHVDAVNATFQGSFLASTGGGRMFVCSPSSSSTLSLPTPPSPNTFDATLYAPLDTSPPVSLSLTTPLLSPLPSGVPGDLAVRLEDAFGNTVLDPSLAVTAEAGDSARLFVSDGTSTFDAQRGVYSLTGLRAHVRAWPEELGQSFDVVVRPLLATDKNAMTTASVVLTLCPVDFGRNSEDGSPLLCSPCTETSYSRENSTAPCQRVVSCPDNALLINSECVSCPPFALPSSRANDTSSFTGPAPPPSIEEDCICVPGSWRGGSSETPCLECPQGATCQGGTETPVARKGWYPVDAVSGNFAECPIADACQAGGACSSGYESGAFMCKDCDGKHQRRGDGGCGPCPGIAASFSMVFALALVITAGLAFAVSYWGVRRGMRRELAKHGMIPYSVSVLLVYLQTLALLHSDTFNWPSSVSRTLESTTMTNVDMSYFYIGCALSSFEDRFVIQIVIPVVFMACVALYVSLYKVFVAQRGGGGDGASRVPAGDIIKRVYVSVLPLAYIPLARIALSFFDCTKLPDGKYYMDSSMEVECFAGLWMQLLPFAVAAFVVYVLALPAGTTYFLFKYRRRLHEPRVRAVFGPMFLPYRSELSFFECVQLAKRLLIVASVLFFSTVAVWMFMALFTMFLVGLIINIKYQPFRLPIHNDLDTKLHISLIILVVVGMFFWADDFESDLTYSCVVIFAFVGIFSPILVLVYSIFLELQARRRLGPGPKTGEGEGMGEGKRKGEELKSVVLQPLEPPLSYSQSQSRSQSSSDDGDEGSYEI